MSYDPELDLFYYGTGNAGPYNAEQRAGDNKWSASVLARKPEDGTLVWAYQFTPHDSWDYDATGAMILADLTIAGKSVHALVHFDKNGFAYTLDRATGRVILAQKFAEANWAKSVDLSTGRPVLNPEMATGVSKGNVKGICPSLEGAVSPASPAAYSPRTHLFYSSTSNMCMDYEASEARYLKGTPYLGVTSPYYAGSGRLHGKFYGLGCVGRQEGMGEQGTVSELERCAGNGGGYRDSTVLSMAGLNRSTREPESCSRSSRLVRVSSATQ